MTPAGVTAVLLGVGVATAVLSELVVEFEFELLEVEELVFVFFEALLCLVAVDFLVLVVVLDPVLELVFELVAALLGAVDGVALATGVLF